MASITPILTVRCEEATGSVMRDVGLVTNYTDAYGVWLFERMRGLPSMFSNQPMRSPEEALRHLRSQKWTVLQLDDVGLLAVGPIRRDGLADVHITFWDKRLRGREFAARKTADWAIAALGLGGVFTAIPVSAKATVAFAKRVGFKVVGYEIGKTKDKAGAVDDALVLVYPY